MKSYSLGITWSEVHRKPRIYEIGDHGGIIVMANDVDATNEIIYSWNEGEKWHKVELTGSKSKFMVVTAIIQQGNV